MKSRREYKKGDFVMLLNDMTHGYKVNYTFSYPDYFNNGGDKIKFQVHKVVLSNDTIHDEFELTFFSEPLYRLAREIKELKDGKKNKWRLKRT